MLKSVRPDNVSKVATRCFNSNSSLRKAIDSMVVMTGEADIITESAPVVFDDFNSIPNITAPQMCRHVVITAKITPCESMDECLGARLYHAGTRAR